VLTTFNETMAQFRSRHGAKLLRFGAVSAFNVILGQMLLYGAQVAVGWSPVVANVFAMTVGAVPAYLLSRYWVWEKRGKSHFLREVVPFWSLALIGFAISTFAIWWVDLWITPSPWVINLTALGAFGIVWLAKFVVLDRILFGPEEIPAT
jgi:putative flippase GtrA